MNRPCAILLFQICHLWNVNFMLRKVKNNLCGKLKTYKLLERLHLYSFEHLQFLTSMIKKKKKKIFISSWDESIFMRTIFTNLQNLSNIFSRNHLDI